MGRGHCRSHVRLAKKTDYSIATTLDTLAATYAETGDFENAITWQEKAVELNKVGLDGDALRQRLALYESSKPYRDIATAPQVSETPK